MCYVSIRPPPWFSLPDQASCAATGSFCGPEARGVCGSDRKPFLPAEHCYHGDSQHHPEGGQRAGITQLRHGLHPNRRHHQRECVPAGDTHTLDTHAHARHTLNTHAHTQHTHSTHMHTLNTHAHASTHAYPRSEEHTSELQSR